MPSDDKNRVAPTVQPEYAERLRRLSGARWKAVLDVQRPYRWNLQRLDLGKTLDVGCGIGRNLSALAVGSVGVDHNPECVDTARRAGFTAYVPGELPQLEFDSLLFSHVLEHMEESAAEALLQAYLPYLKVAGTVVFMTPQEAGFASDPTHVHFTDFDGLSRIARGQRLVPVSMYSFPFPRFAGRFFRYNEFVLIARSLT